MRRCQGFEVKLTMTSPLGALPMKVTESCENSAIFLIARHRIEL